MPIYGFLPATDPRMRSTIEAIARDLTEDGLVLRYRAEEGLNADGLTGEEGTFVICSFWLVSCLAQAGEVERAEALFDQLAGYANDLGLLGEEIDTANGEQLGNFPQAYSHIGLITAAYEIDKAKGAAHEPTSTSSSSAAGPPESTAPPPRRRRPEGRDRRARAARRRVLLLGLHPVQDARAARRGAGGARARRPGTGGGRRRRGGARVARLHGLLPTTTAARRRGRRRRHRGAARRGPARRVRAACASATRPTPRRHVVLATGSEPVVPPVRGLQGLEGVWTNREATGLTEVPRRLLVLGGGPVGLELGQALVRMGASVAIVEGADRPAGPRARARRGDRRRWLARRRPRPPRRRRAARGRRVPARARGRSRRRASCARSIAQPAGRSATCTGVWPLTTYVGKTGPDRRRQHPGETPKARLHRRPAGRVHRPAGGGVRRARRPAHGDGPAGLPCRAPRPTPRAYAEQPGFMTLVSDGERRHRRVRDRPGGGRVAPAGDARIRARVPLSVFDVIVIQRSDLLESSCLPAAGADRAGPVAA